MPGRFGAPRQRDAAAVAYRTALALRRTEEGFGDGPMTWLPAPEGVLTFARPRGPVCVVDLSPAPTAPPRTNASSSPADHWTRRARLPADTAAWLRT